MQTMQIGEAARQAGLSTTTIRYYEDIALMPHPPRAPNGYRNYGPDAIERLRFIREAQETGLTLAEIASVLELRRQGEPTCHHVVDLLERHLEDVDRRIEALLASRESYSSLIERAKTLEPADCTDPNRCQTISAPPLQPNVQPPDPAWGWRSNRQAQTKTSRAAAAR
jgi:MerR family copper efflux transcriptional regulator